MPSSDELLKTMVNKGWNKEEISKAMMILYGDENQDKRISFQERMNFTIYWMVILGLVVCNFLIAMLMVPLLLVLPGASLYFTIGLLGLLF